MAFPTATYTPRADNRRNRNTSTHRCVVLNFAVLCICNILDYQYSVVFTCSWFAHPIYQQNSLLPPHYHAVYMTCSPLWCGMWSVTILEFLITDCYIIFASLLLQILQADALFTCHIQGVSDDSEMSHIECTWEFAPMLVHL